MARLRWQEAPKTERLTICAFYAQHITQVEGTTITIEELDTTWYGCWFDVIRFTFGPDSWQMNKAIN